MPSLKLSNPFLVEGDCPDPRDPTDAAVAGLTRAVLAFTGLGEPPGYTGFGYEADHFARGRAVCSGAGSVPAWAVAEIEAEGEREDAPENDAALPALSFPDAGLIALGLELDASEQRERAEETEADAATDADARGAAEARINAACAETAAILERLATMPAHTAEGLRIKLRAIRHGIVAVDGSTTSCRVFRSLLRDAGVSETDLAAAAEG